VSWASGIVLRGEKALSARRACRDASRRSQPRSWPLGRRGRGVGGGGGGRGRRAGRPPPQATPPAPAPALAQLSTRTAANRGVASLGVALTIFAWRGALQVCLRRALRGGLFVWLSRGSWLAPRVFARPTPARAQRPRRACRPNLPPATHSFLGRGAHRPRNTRGGGQGVRTDWEQKTRRPRARTSGGR